MVCNYGQRIVAGTDTRSELAQVPDVMQNNCGNCLYGNIRL